MTSFVNDFHESRWHLKGQRNFIATFVCQVIEVEIDQVYVDVLVPVHLLIGFLSHVADRVQVAFLCYAVLYVSKTSVIKVGREKYLNGTILTLVAN